jgi:hypothetical protein
MRLRQYSHSFRFKSGRYTHKDARKIRQRIGKRINYSGENAEHGEWGTGERRCFIAIEKM